MMTTQRKITTSITAAPSWMTLTVLLFSCGTPPMKSYYTLENTPGKDATNRVTPLCQMPLGVDPVHVVPPYDLTKIVFRPDDLEVRFYTNRYWVSAPEEMMTKLIVRRLRDANLFASADTSMYVTGAHLTLIAKLQNLEETDRDGVWNGRVAMDFVLKEEMEDVTLWTYEFDVTRQVPDQEVKSVLGILNQIYNDEMDAVVKSLEAHFKTEGGCGVKATPAEGRARKGWFGRDDDEDDEEVSDPYAE